MLADSLLRAGLVPANLDVKALRRDIDMLLGQFGSASLAELRMDLLIQMVTEAVFRHHVTMPADLMLVGRAMGTMESIARKIDPGFVPLQQVQPMLVSTFVRYGLDPTHAAERWVDTVFAWESLAHSLPKEISDVMRRLREGQLVVKRDSRQVRQEALESNRRLNRAVGVAFAMGGNALAIFAYSAGAAPDWLAVSAAVVSTIMGGWAFLGIVRSGGM
jgi:ubiquinone biosynthesis protein